MANAYRLRSQTFQIVCEHPSAPYLHCTSPSNAEPILRSIFADLDETQEHFVVICMDAKGKVIGHKVLSSGIETACLVTPAMVFRAALILGGVSVLACHNHPSGVVEPSREDQELTRRMRTAAEALGIVLADHIILGHESVYSFRASQAWDRS